MAEMATTGRAPVIETHGLARSFGEVRALDGFDVSIPGNQVVALVGPNGAGKTTLLLILAGLLAPDAGTVSVADVDPVERPFDVHRIVGWMPDFFGVYDSLTPTEYLELFGAAYRLGDGERSRRARELLALVALEDQADVPVHALSRGQKQRLGFARTIVHSPQVLLLDEPASGLDPRSRIALRELVRQQVQEGSSVLISSHILSELEEMADFVVFADRGRFKGAYALNELPAGGLRRWRVRTQDPAALRDSLMLTGRRYSEGTGGSTLVEVASDEEAADLVADLVGRGLRVVEFSPERGGLEGAFLAMDRQEP